MVHTLHLSLVLFSVHNGKLMVYARDNRLPSRPLARGEHLDDAKKALLVETLKTKNPLYVEQLYTTSDPIERGSVVVVYFALCASESLPSHLLGDMRPAQSFQAAFLEKDILSYAIQRLQWKVEYTNIIYSLLPLEFALGDVQRVYEAILGYSMDKRNFRKKILSLGLLQETGRKRKVGQSRPAETYCFRKRSLQYVNIL
jgi:8-oxo-dGTP diphosphatase